ncbi:endonuclease/exonuclease/phosphatase family protein [Rheinheimera texasensis]|uniref:endonuclease/exonuclease/phosphatase family protein n=1 Tax=Rheinheimera texasensis TaxID=306205 RepID=UPI0009FC92B1|nr:endonuclease/exonuclease/phosphatase family protein [Rheinheimera texasensis]
MQQGRSGSWCAVLALLLFTSSAALADTFKALSWNIRLDTPNDAELAWPHRAGKVISQLQQQAPDIIGLQEVMVHQLVRLESALPGYQRIGVGRDDGKNAGEFSPLLIRRDRFVILDSGTFWFHPSWDPTQSGTEIIGFELIGKPGWDAALPRICSWALLKDKHSGKQLRVLNLHLDHQGAEARRESVKLIAAKIQHWQRTSHAPVVVMGDFNPASGDGLLAQIQMSLPQYQDALAQTKTPQGPNYSFIPWRGNEADAVRLDFMLLRADQFKVPAAGILADGPPTQLSDHLALWAELEL